MGIFNTAMGTGEITASLAHQAAHCHAWQAPAFSGPCTLPLSPSEHFHKRTRAAGWGSMKSANGVKLFSFSGLQG